MTGNTDVLTNAFEQMLATQKEIQFMLQKPELAQLEALGRIVQNFGCANYNYRCSPQTNGDVLVEMELAMNQSPDAIPTSYMPPKSQPHPWDDPRFALHYVDLIPKGYEWKCPGCQAVNDHKPNERHPDLLQEDEISCTACGRIFIEGHKIAVED